MALWWSALVLVVCVGVHADTQEWGSCGPVVCQEVVRQAQGLARLKLLRNYVSQAMELLDLTMDSIEDEVTRSGQSLSQFIGRGCNSAHTILHQIMQDVDDDNYGLNHGTHTSTSQSSTYVSPATTTQQGTIGGYTHGGGDYDDDWPDINQGESGGDADDSIEQSSTVVSQDLQTSSTSNYRLTNKFDRDNQDSREDYTTQGYGHRPRLTTSSSTTSWRTNQGTGGSGSGYGGGDPDSSTEYGQYTSTTSNHLTRPGHRGHGHHSGSHHGGHRGHGSHHGGHGGRGSHQGGRDVGGAGCRGVEQGHPFWVPGIDNWCATNCAAGNCPLDRCVC